jgi:hypothetical protein
MVFKNLEFFWIWRFEETSSTSLFLTVWETGYAEAHAGPFTREDLDSSDPPKVFLRTYQAAAIFLVY